MNGTPMSDNSSGSSYFGMNAISLGGLGKVIASAVETANGSPIATSSSPSTNVSPAKNTREKRSPYVTTRPSMSYSYISVYMCVHDALISQLIDTPFAIPCLDECLFIHTYELMFMYHVGPLATSSAKPILSTKEKDSSPIALTSGKYAVASNLVKMVTGYGTPSAPEGKQELCKAALDSMM